MHCSLKLDDQASASLFPRQMDVLTPNMSAAHPACARAELGCLYEIPALLQAQADGAHLLITPHAAFYSDEAFVGALRVSFRYLGHTPRQRTANMPADTCPSETGTEMRGLAAREVGRILTGEPAQYQVN